MGTYRLILAVLVALGHAGLGLLGYQIGFSAVVSFLILSGYVMSLMIGKYYHRLCDITDFYKDRLARLFPQFLLYLTLASVCILGLHLHPSNIAQLTPFKWALNFLMLPGGFYMYWGNDVMILPPTWSLGLELTFYMVIPFILIYCNSTVIYALALASIAVFITAFFGALNTDYFGYRLLPGTLFIFLVGWSFHQGDRQALLYRRAVLIGAIALWYFAYFRKSYYALEYNKEVLVGLIGGILVIERLVARRFSAVDEFLGNLSYGVFLNHFIVIWLLQKYAHIDQFSLVSFCALILISMLLAYCSYLIIERPALSWRRRLRKGVLDQAGGSLSGPLVSR